MQEQRSILIVSNEIIVIIIAIGKTNASSIDQINTDIYAKLTKANNPRATSAQKAAIVSSLIGIFTNPARKPVVQANP